MKRITAFQSENGKVFLTEKEAVYEDELTKLRQELGRVISDYDERENVVLWIYNKYIRLEP